MAGFQPVMAAGPIEYKRKYTLWVLVILVLFCWPIALIYYFTRDKVPVQELSTYAMPAQAPPMGAPMAAPACPKCGKAATWVAQYNRWYCDTDRQYL